MRRFVLTSLVLAVGLVPPIAAQSIEVGELDSAALYDVGILESSNGGLDQNLWQGTDASRAVFLLDQLSLDGADPLVHDFVRSVVLSGGVPPTASDPEMGKNYARKRLQTMLDLGEMGAAQTIIGRTPALADDRILEADMALMAGDNVKACAVADTVIEGRGAPEWARLRAFCHVQRGEIPAAELTLDILRSSDYDDLAYFSLMTVVSGGVGKPDLKHVRADDALHVALMAQAGLEWPKNTPSRILAARRALNEASSPADRLSALYAAGPALSDQQMGMVLDALAAENTLQGGATGVLLDEALNAPFPEGTGQLWQIARFGMSPDRPKALAELLRRADRAGAFDRFASLLSSNIQGVPPAAQALENPELFVRAAIKRSDISTLQGIYRALDEDFSKQARIALVTDALGNGFLSGPVGLDIETRLTMKGTTRARAERDMFVALGMGARLSGMSGTAFADLGSGKGRKIDTSDALAMEAAARSGSRAETVLWAAHSLTGSRLDNEGIYRVIAALNHAGLSKLAGRVAADDFLAGLE